ncbi:signal peptide peptidase [Plasmodium falciparum NF54]|uniref:Signal peptide peptidase n=9 Tax=Plasmodium falciparum TaxID=5833 RepID=Q8IKQ9_PLAF7|nr:signal peptide peptidase [Plasmodium falciparum 3D7]ACN22086.1 signal peptide peptidase [Plasmodium falciparum]KAF4328950.1 signal peptide peptidase [Plasmodium falciparum NF54]SOS81395.1 signal peptide peptidase [Plasmodium sp. gorilla clade G1]ACN22087.1 signal peptide peptidase [Plasmodium falciparum]ACN22088.1 signal peptide peptidase [Plasmodium falciparum]|eukprot:XP_001348717.2 signal peptide peptidase [Plasmodium falciparum 3D7]
MNLLKLIGKNKKMKNENMGNSIFYYSCYVIIVLTIILSKFVVIPLMAQMFLYTFITIYIGSHDSLKQLEIDDKTKKSDNITAYDAMMFPVIGSAALLTLYFAYKFLDPFYVNLLLTLYLTLAGVFSLQGVFTTILEPVFPNFFKKDEYVKTFKLPNFIYKEPIVFNTNKGEIVCLILSFAIGLRWIFYKDFITHNVLAVSFCFQAISLVILSNFLIGFLLLSGLFVYDIFWVFGNDVMVTVAKSFEAPVKLLFPVSSDPVHYSMLGLGDIIIPGILMSLCLRFDYYLFKNNIHKGNLKKMFNDISIHESFKKYYFYTIIIFYELGLVVTYCMLFYFEHPQPALLYLVPACILAILACSICKREFKLMIKYQEITDKSNTVDDASKNKKKDKEEIPKIQETPVSNAKKRITNK